MIFLHVNNARYAKKEAKWQNEYEYFFCQKPKRQLGKFMFFQCIMPLLSEILGRLKTHGS